MWLCGYVAMWLYGYVAKFQNFKFWNFNFQISNFPHFKFGNFRFSNLTLPKWISEILFFEISHSNMLKVRYTYLPRFSEFQFVRSEKYYVSYNCWSIFGDKYVVRGYIFGHMFGRSKNIPKSIAIDQESLINHLGIIKSPRKTRNTLKNQEKQKIRFLFWTLLDPVLGPIWWFG